MASTAWRISPFDVYASTETGGIAAECAQHAGLHLFEDLVIVEVVSPDYRPVPPGEVGERLLVTVLFSRTLPLIRYEISDRVRLATDPCPCGLPFAKVSSVDGRVEDMIQVPGAAGGLVWLHPEVFHNVLDLLDAAGWQVRQEVGRLRLLVARSGAAFDARAIELAMTAALAAAGAALPVHVDVVDDIPAGITGKRPFVVGA
jgi:phenylacetate-coenzyme A ligase PaaK-like adenylate-forming protein